MGNAMRRMREMERRVLEEVEERATARASRYKTKAKASSNKHADTREYADMYTSAEKVSPKAASTQQQPVSEADTGEYVLDLITLKRRRKSAPDSKWSFKPTKSNEIGTAKGAEQSLASVPSSIESTGIPADQGEVADTTSSIDPVDKTFVEKGQTTAAPASTQSKASPTEQSECKPRNDLNLQGQYRNPTKTIEKLTGSSQYPVPEANTEERNLRKGKAKPATGSLRELRIPKENVNLDLLTADSIRKSYENKRVDVAVDPAKDKHPNVEESVMQVEPQEPIESEPKKAEAKQVESQQTDPEEIKAENANVKQIQSEELHVEKCKTEKLEGTLPNPADIKLTGDEVKLSQIMNGEVKTEPSAEEFFEELSALDSKSAEFPRPDENVFEKEELQDEQNFFEAANTSNTGSNPVKSYQESSPLPLGDEVDHDYEPSFSSSQAHPRAAEANHQVHEPSKFRFREPIFAKEYVILTPSQRLIRTSTSPVSLSTSQPAPDMLSILSQVQQPERYRKSIAKLDKQGWHLIGPGIKGNLMVFEREYDVRRRRARRRAKIVLAVAAGLSVSTLGLLGFVESPTKELQLK